MQPGMVVIGIAAFGMATVSDARPARRYAASPVPQSAAIADLNRQSLERVSKASPVTAPVHAAGSPTISAPPVASSPNVGRSSAPPAGDSVAIPPGVIAPPSPTPTSDGPQPK